MGGGILNIDRMILQGKKIYELTNEELIELKHSNPITIREYCLVEDEIIHRLTQTGNKEK